jgi:hypothetical protein
MRAWASQTRLRHELQELAGAATADYVKQECPCGAEVTPNDVGLCEHEKCYMAMGACCACLCGDAK